jgi:hypothetical protein
MARSRFHDPIEPMTLDNMRENGVRSLDIQCHQCLHQVILNVDWPLGPEPRRCLIAISCQLERCWRGLLGWRVLTADLLSPSSISWRIASERDRASQAFIHSSMRSRRVAWDCAGVPEDRDQCQNIGFATSHRMITSPLRRLDLREKMIWPQSSMLRACRIAIFSSSGRAAD